MKLSELAKATNVPKHTIQFYLREGLLPKPPLKRKKLADYGESYIDEIEFIKDLQENHDLPVSVIKQIIRRQRKVSRLERSLFRIQTKYLSPRAHLLTRGIAGEENFREATGLGAKWLQKFEDWGIIKPELRDGVKRYDYDDLMLGRLIVDMDVIGLGPKDGADPEALLHAVERFRELLQQINGYFAERYWGKLSEEQFFEKGTQAREIYAIYCYHLFRRLAKDDTRERVIRIEQEKASRR
ncbi:MAG: MerR family transcriptional regulator [Desulfomonile tiedjei]|nr:MerR family transcriptional regulator [Desulfomonile tiedjei]